MLPPLAWYLTLVGIAVLGLCFIVAARRAPERGPSPAELTSRIRTRGAWVLGVAALPITLGSLAYAPLVTEARVPDGTTTVRIVGHQWYWELSQNEVPVGELIRFEVTSADVNHGFALYDEQLRLVAQTQAMPQYSNALQVRFDTPGTYKVLCLEYCGLVHHGMTATLEVSDRAASGSNTRASSAESDGRDAAAATPANGEQGEAANVAPDGEHGA